MAGDWLPIRHDLPEDPAVIAIAAAVGIDEDSVVGKLLRVWRWFDTHTVDGNAASVTKTWLDRYLGVTGFADAMVNEGWLADAGGGLSIPEFDKYISQSAKQRALTAKRVAAHKAEKKRSGNAASVTNALPKEQNRREELNTIPPIAPQGADAPDESGGESASEEIPPPSTDELEPFLAVWNRTDGVVPVRTCTPNRKKAFRARCRDPAWLADAHAALAKFPLRCFSQPGAYRPKLDWFLRPDTVLKILEGAYDWYPSSRGQPANGRHTAATEYDPAAKPDF